MQYAKGFTIQYLPGYKVVTILGGAGKVAPATRYALVPRGTPEDLVLDGTFAAAFAREGLAFDAATGTFPLHETHGPAVRLVGSGPAAFWTRRALARAGYTLATDPEALAELTVTGAGSQQQWAL